MIDEYGWERARRLGAVRPPSLDALGFVHLCTPAQLAGVLARFYPGRDDLLVLHVDASQLPKGALLWELAEDTPGERFPHLYAPLPVEAVARAAPVTPAGR